VLDRWRASGDYDLEHFEQFGVTPYRRAGTPSTALVQNVESIIYARGRRRAGLLSRTWAMVEGGKLARREPEILRGFDAVFVLSPGDREALAAEGVRHITVVPMPAPPLRPVRTEPGPPTILSLGSMSWFGVADGLTWFHDRVLPSLRARLPDLRWQLVGPGAPPVVRSFARDPRIDLAGYVEDLDPYVAAARVAIIPLHIAGGIRMKLLDLMAWGLPSVATEIGAQGLEFADGEGCFRRDDPEAFGDAVHALLTDDALWRSTVAAGQAYVARRHAPGNLDAAVAGGVADAIAAHRGPATG
jgi:glycosyltransferase involved in cell wall biosynthesis